MALDPPSGQPPEILRQQSRPRGTQAIGLVALGAMFYR